VLGNLLDFGDKLLGTDGLFKYWNLRTFFVPGNMMTLCNFFKNKLFGAIHIHAHFLGLPSDKIFVIIKTIPKDNENSNR